MQLRGENSTATAPEVLSQMCADPCKWNCALAWSRYGGLCKESFLGGRC